MAEHDLSPNYPPPSSVLRAIRLAALGGAWALASLASAQQGGAWVPDWSSPMPNYFSGTNCRAKGTMYVKQPPPGWPSPPQFLDAQLYVGGTQVASWTNPLDVPYQEVSLVAMFDSSHFAPDSTVHVRITGHDNVIDPLTGLPRFYDSDVDDPGNDAPARNKAILFEHPDLDFTPDAVPVANAALIGKNYDRYIDNGGEWSEETYWSEMNGANVAFYAGHGNPSMHNSGIDEPMFWSEYLANRTSHIGSGIPPFNTGAPPVNFLYLLTCNCGDTNNFVRACYPYYMAWGGPWMENQCWMGYKVWIETHQLQQHADLIWPRLVEGWTVSVVQDIFDDYLRSDANTLVCWDDYEEGKAPRPMRPGDLALYANYDENEGGDGGACRIKTVYTGTHVPPLGWYFQLGG